MSTCAVSFETYSVDLLNKAFVVDEMTGTKTLADRTVLLNERALAAAQRQLDWLRRRPDGDVPCLHPTGTLFLDPGTGKQWAYEQNARKRYWGPTLDALVIRYRRPYNTRHTNATLGILAGARPAFMAQQLGHTLEVFYKHYQRWVEEAQSLVEVGKINRHLQEVFPGGTIPELSPEVKKSPL